MAVQYFLLGISDGKLNFSQVESPSVNCADDGTPPEPWAVHSSLGDDNKIWCQIYRIKGEPGGFFVLRDFDEVLFAAHAKGNLDFVFGVETFAKMVSNYRYAMDIFENIDMNFDEEDA